MARTKYTVVALNSNNEVIGSKWTYNRNEVKGIALFFKRLGVAKVKINNQVWTF